jgi:uncharacterized cupin superfamily protein
MPNVKSPEWEAELPGLRGARIGRQAGSSALRATLYEVEPGGRVSPLHVHHANEELLVVLAGTPTLRTADGERELADGELVAFPPGPGGAHQVLNRSGAPARVLIASTAIFPEVAEHLDSDKFLILTGPFGEPGSQAYAFRRGDAVPPMEGEEG